MQVSSDRISFSLSQSGSASAGKSRKARQMVRSPWHAMGSITFFTISSRSFDLNTRASPFLSRILVHLRGTRRRG